MIDIFSETNKIFQKAGQQFMNRNTEPEGAKQPSEQARYFADCFDIRQVSEFEDWVGETGDIDLTERFVSCVNALAGITNPAAVKQVIEAAREIWIETAIDTPPSLGVIAKLGAAISALNQPVSEVNQDSTVTQERKT